MNLLARLCRRLRPQQPSQPTPHPHYRALWFAGTPRAGAVYEARLATAEALTRLAQPTTIHDAALTCRQHGIACRLDLSGEVVWIAPDGTVTGGSRS